MVQVNFSGRRVCVTGGAGFIGSHLVEGLVSSGAQVCVLDDLSSGSLQNLHKVEEDIQFLRDQITTTEVRPRAVPACRPAESRAGPC